MRADVTGSLCLPGKSARGVLSNSRLIRRPVLVTASRLTQQAGERKFE